MYDFLLSNWLYCQLISGYVTGAVYMYNIISETMHIYTYIFYILVVIYIWYLSFFVISLILGLWITIKSKTNVYWVLIYIYSQLTGVSKYVWCTAWTKRLYMTIYSTLVEWWLKHVQIFSGTTITIIIKITHLHRIKVANFWIILLCNY